MSKAKRGLSDHTVTSAMQQLLGHADSAKWLLSTVRSPQLTISRGWFEGLVEKATKLDEALAAKKESRR